MFKKFFKKKKKKLKKKGVFLINKYIQKIHIFVRIIINRWYSDIEVFLFKKALEYKF